MDDQIIRWGIEVQNFLFFKEILVQDHFYRKFSISQGFFDLDICLPLLMMIILLIVSMRLSVRLCTEWYCNLSFLIHRYLNVHNWFISIWCHFDDRAEDTFVWGIILIFKVIISCLSPHSEGDGCFPKKRTISETLSVCLLLNTKCYEWSYMLIVIFQRNYVSLVSFFCWPHRYYDYWIINPFVSISLLFFS